MNKVQQPRFKTKTKFLKKKMLTKLNNNLNTRGISRTQIENYLMETYKIINELELIFENRPPKNRIVDKDYVGTVECVRNISETVARNILNALCNKASLTAYDTAAKLIDNIGAKINRETNTVPTDGSRSEDVQFGVINAIIEILNAAEGGPLPAIKNTIHQTVQMNPSGKAVRQNNVTGVNNDKALALRNDARVNSLKLRDQNRRKFNNQNRSTAAATDQKIEIPLDSNIN